MTIQGLLGRKFWETLGVSDIQSLFQPLRRVVGNRDGFQLSLADEVLKTAERLFGGRHLIIIMNLVEIHVVRLQPPQ